ncbi:MAG TPA: hypothetical protein VHT92_11880 [Candidatus Cybelea sp.]|nr:hypothetical protein [Candidatus Cybelea sp.]
MTDDELQQFADSTVRLTFDRQALTGKLITGFEAQVRVNAPYALQWHDLNPTSGTKEERLVAIPSAEVVESIELVNENVSEEIEDAAEDAQTPG